MPVIIPLLRRRRGRSRNGSNVAPAALVLVAAAYEAGTVPPTVTLVFDRAIDVSGIAGAAIVVSDEGDLGETLTGTGAVTLLGPATVRIGLVKVGDPLPGSTTLTATAGNGIVAADDGGAWAGVTDLVLPFA
jgi:hypothetical protein